jgi:hypothetical protein
MCFSLGSIGNSFREERGVGHGTDAPLLHRGILPAPVTAGYRAKPDLPFDVARKA